jgi:hypothetical protein
MQHDQWVTSSSIGKTRMVIGQIRAVIVFSRHGIGTTRMSHRNFTAADFRGEPPRGVYTVPCGAGAESAKGRGAGERIFPLDFRQAASGSIYLLLVSSALRGDADQS